MRLQSRSGTCRPSVSKQEGQRQRSSRRQNPGGHKEVKAKETISMNCRTHGSVQRARGVPRLSEGLQSSHMGFLPLVPESDGQYILL